MNIRYMIVFGVMIAWLIDIFTFN